MYGQAALTRRRQLGEKLLPTFVHTYDQLNAMLQGIGPEDWEKPCYHTHRLRPVHSFLPTIIQELAVHEWDLRSSLEPSPSLSVASIPILLEKLPTNRRPGPCPSRPERRHLAPYAIVFALTGMDANRRDIVVEGNKARIEPPGEAPANLYVRGDMGTFVLLMYGRLSLDSAIATGHCKAEGDLALVSDFDRWLEGH